MKATSSHLQHAPIVLKHHCQLKMKRLCWFQILSTRMPEAPHSSVRSKEAESAPLASDQNLKTANVEQWVYRKIQTVLSILTLCSTRLSDLVNAANTLCQLLLTLLCVLLTTQAAPTLWRSSGRRRSAHTRSSFCWTSSRSHCTRHNLRCRCESKHTHCLGILFCPACLFNLLWPSLHTCSCRWSRQSPEISSCLWQLGSTRVSCRMKSECQVAMMWRLYFHFPS